MKKFTVFFVFAFLISTGLFAQNGGMINPQKGAKYLVENKVNTESSSEMMGQKMETKANITSTYNIEVKDIAQNNINFKNTITTLKMNVNAMGQDASFDSEKEEDMNGEIGKNFKDYINKPKDVVMDKAGNVILSADSTGPDSANAMENPTTMMMKQMGGDPEEQGYGAKMAFLAIPAKATPGSTWTDSSSAHGTTKVTHYTLKEVNGSEGKITLTGTINSELKTEMQGMDVLTKTSGNFTGEETVDIKTGLVKEHSTTTDASGTVTVMGQEIPSSSKITSVTTVKSL